MDILQTYETTIFSADGRFSLSVLVIPARTYGYIDTQDDFVLHEAGGYLFGGIVDTISPVPSVQPEMIMRLIAGDAKRDDVDLQIFAAYAANARIIPFEQSPLGAESLAGIAIKSARVGTVGLGATVGYLVAGTTPFLLIAVPLGIVLCGASVSFAKWLEENRKSIWSKLLKQPDLHRSPQKKVKRRVK